MIEQSLLVRVEQIAGYLEPQTRKQMTTDFTKDRNVIQLDKFSSIIIFLSQQKYQKNWSHNQALLCDRAESAR